MYMIDTSSDPFPLGQWSVKLENKFAVKSRRNIFVAFGVHGH